MTAAISVIAILAGPAMLLLLSLAILGAIVALLAGVIQNGLVRSSVR